MQHREHDDGKHKGHDKGPVPGEVTPNALPDDESGGGGHTDPDAPPKKP